MTVALSSTGAVHRAERRAGVLHSTRSISFQIDCADQDEVDHYWSSSSDGGEEGPCGWLKDRFGLSWQVVPSPPRELLSDSDRDGRSG